LFSGGGSLGLNAPHMRICCPGDPLRCDLVHGPLLRRGSLAGLFIPIAFHPFEMEGRVDEFVCLMIVGWCWLESGW
jgi:hypothetical protein